jgi:hypothetical protein
VNRRLAGLAVLTLAATAALATAQGRRAETAPAEDPGALQAGLVPASNETRIQIHHLDGTTEDLGVVAAQYRDPERQAAWETTGAAGAAARIDAANTRPKE